VNNLNQEKNIFDYYYNQFSFTNLVKSTTSSMVFYSLPNSFSITNKLIISKMASDTVVNEVQFTAEYAASMLGYLTVSLTSFSVVALGKHSEYYHDHPFAVGVLVSTAGDIAKLSYDTGSEAYYLIMGADNSNMTEEF
jgi:hypothetical protein